MPEDLISHPAYTNEDIAKWLTSQAEAIRKSGAVVPAWVTGGFEDAMKVEKTVFSVIKDWLTVESSTFRDMFSLPSIGCTPAAVEGTLIWNPIVLEHTSAASFKAFLCLLYGPRGKPPQTCNEWVGALELAMRWNFDQVRKEALAGLNLIFPSLGPSARILLGRRFSVAPWLRTGLIDLVTEVIKKRVNRNNLIEGNEFALDMTTVANVFYTCFELERHNRESGVSPGMEYEPCPNCKAMASFFKCGIPDCPACKDLRDKARALREHAQFSRDVQLKVDDIFGAEIEGCLYNEAL